MGPGDVIIGRPLLDFLRRDCEMRRPEEACGLLVGRFRDDRVQVSDVMPVRNQSMSAMRFSIDPVEMFKALKKVEGAGETIVGVYHSHPRSVEPSATDVSYMKDTSYVWLIVEACGRIGAFAYEDGSVKEVPLKTG